MSAAVASETLSPFSASREISACPGGWPSPAATSMAPSSLRSSATACDSQSTRGPDVGGRGVLEEFLFDGVLIEPGDGAQPPGDGSTATAARFQVASEAFDVGAADGEQVQGAGAAPGGELTQIQRVCLAGQAAVPGQEAGEREPFGVAECWLEGAHRHPVFRLYVTGP
jgi:hypothetical protein